MFSKNNLINTPLQRGEKSGNDVFNRFSGFPRHGDIAAWLETAEAVHFLRGRAVTPLKRGVNEIASRARTSRAFRSRGLPRASSAGFQPAVSQIFNLQGGGSYVVPADWKSAIRQAESLRYESAGLTFGRRSHA